MIHENETTDLGENKIKADPFPEYIGNAKKACDK